MSIVVRGSVMERRGRRVEVARAFGVSILGADIEHDDLFGPAGATLFSLHFRDNSLDCEELASLARWQWSAAGPVARSLVRLRAAIAREADASERDQIVIDAIAAADGDAASHGASRPPTWLGRARDAIDDSAVWPTATELAGIAGVHRAHLAREFKRFFGVSISTYTRRRALQRAAGSMERGETMLSRIAHESGFHDHAHMCHCFRGEVGCSPREAMYIVSGRPPQLPR